MSNKKEHEEVWKTHPEFPYYEFSSLGQVRNKITKEIKEVKRPKNSNYYVLRRKDEGKIKTKFLHKIMVELFIGPVPPNMTIDHINGNPRDNRAANLEIVTKKENTRRQIKMWSHPHSFYNRDLVAAHSEKRWVYNGKIYNWIEILKILHAQGIIYYQVKWESGKDGRIGRLPNGEFVQRVKNIEKWQDENLDEF